MSTINHHPFIDRAWPPKHIAVVYDRVNTKHGGAELVLLAIHQVFPQADLVTSVADLTQASWAKVFPKIKTSWLQAIPGANRLHRWLAQFMPLAFETLDLAQYDLIISVTSAEAKGILASPDQLHVCYLLAPPRYLYHQQTELLEASKLIRLPGVNWLAKQALSYLKWWDQVAIHRPDIIIPLSQRVTNQVKTFYALPPQTLTPVLYPPINLRLPDSTKLIDSLGLPQTYFLQVGRLVSYKKVALSLEAAVVAQQNLVVVGEGPDLIQLKALAKTLATQTQAQLIILGAIDQAKLQTIYAHCRGLLLPGEEDFGLTALEANAAGKPVIINHLSGAAEVITDQLHGLHLLETSPVGLAELMLKSLKHPWDAQLLRQNAAKYGTSIFITKFDDRLKTYWHKYHQKNI